MRILPASILFCMSCCVLDAAQAQEQTSIPTPLTVAKPAVAATAAGQTPGIDGYQTNGRWREGTRLQQVAGSFTSSGERLQFVSADGKVQVLATENLLAERVLRSVQESSEPLQWVVQGTMTEYRGVNYLTLLYASITPIKARTAAKEGLTDLGRDVSATGNQRPARNP